MKKLIALFFVLTSLCISAQPPAEGGIEFDGVSNYIKMKDSDNINTSEVSNRTIETYFKVDDGFNRQVFYKEGANVNSIKFYVENGELYVGSYRKKGGNGNSIFFKTPIDNNSWYHVALVIEKQKSMLFYLNGKLQEANPNYFKLPHHSGDFVVGRSKGNVRYPNCDTWSTNGITETCLDDVTDTVTTTNYFKGHIWGFRMWNVARTAADINTNKDKLITDTTTAPGNQLLAFTNGNVMTFLNSNDDYENANLQGASLGVDDPNLDDVKIIVKNNTIEVINGLDRIPDALLLYTLEGKLVRQSTHQSYLSASQLSNGIYILKCIYQGHHLNRKVILMK